MRRMMMASEPLSLPLSRRGKDKNLKLKTHRIAAPSVSRSPALTASCSGSGSAASARGSARSAANAAAASGIPLTGPEEEEGAASPCGSGTHTRRSPLLTPSEDSAAAGALAASGAPSRRKVPAAAAAPPPAPLNCAATTARRCWSVASAGSCVIWREEGGGRSERYYERGGEVTRSFRKKQRGCRRAGIDRWCVLLRALFLESISGSLPLSAPRGRARHHR